MVFSSFIPFLSLDFYDYSLSKKLITYFCCIFSDAEFLVLLFPIVKVNTMPDSLSIMFDVRIYRSFLRFILRLCSDDDINNKSSTDDNTYIDFFFYYICTENKPKKNSNK